jgi:hypothetical protein
MGNISEASYISVNVVVYKYTALSSNFNKILPEKQAGSYILWPVIDLCLTVTDDCRSIGLGVLTRLGDIGIEVLFPARARYFSL